MIAKRIESRQRTASNVVRLTRYIVNAKGGIDPRNWERTADYVLDLHADPNEKGEKVSGVRVTNCHTDDPADATCLILATQARNTRSGKEKTYHLVFSFPPGEHPSLNVLHEIEDALCESIGYADHQRVSAVHIDTDHLHVHVAINKVHPIGLQNIEPYYDQKRLMQACEQLEIKYGLERTNHGIKGKEVGRGSGVTSRIKSIEDQSGIETLATYITKNVGRKLSEAKDWQSVHAALFEYGLLMKPRGTGLIIGDVRSNLWVRASQCQRDFSMKNMTDRFGPYEAPKGQWKQKPGYVSRPVHHHPSSANLFSQYQREKQLCLLTRKKELEKIRTDSAAYLLQLRHWKNHQQVMLKLGNKGVIRKMMGADIRRQAVLARKNHQASNQRKRKQVLSNAVMPSWSDWLMQKAMAGDRDALEVLRSRENRERRFRGDLLRAAGDFNLTKSILLKAFNPAVRKDGTVSYRTADGGTVMDRKDHIQTGKVSTVTTLFALTLAVEKFGGRALIVEGTKDFCEKVSELAAIHRLNITFVDPVMEQHRQQKVTAFERVATINKIPVNQAAVLNKPDCPKVPEDKEGVLTGNQDQVSGAVIEWIQKRNVLKDRQHSLEYHRLWMVTDAGNAIYQGRRKMMDGSEVLLLKKGNDMLVKPCSSRVVAKASRWKIGRSVFIDRQGRFIGKSKEIEI